MNANNTDPEYFEHVSKLFQETASPTGSPIFGRDNEWFFWDETGADFVGPYESRAKAVEGLENYVIYLNGNV